MKIEIINKELKLDVSGFLGVAANKNYAGTAFALMDKMWPVIKAKGLKHKGLNIWIYEANEKVFAGVELEDTSITDTGLEQKTILLPRYAYYKHIGSYSQLKQAGDNMRNEIQKMGLKARLPYIEIYGHWTNDESKLETEMLMAVE
ncbi:GyrI-like domain-containing protein [Mucilaginibacter sp.]|uniref:GyrI-like domain-containing protein n=1 Tax=Mucilaginibacter sp. TaxID=1882438 RepID=UPI0025F0E5A8|nr:GyrI-like domain-containing protein [Mucilaginibacter sp.]